MQIKTIFTPVLYNYTEHNEDFICVVVDVLRATTTMCTIIEYQGRIIPVASLDEAREYKKKGFLVAGERIEQTLDFADYGNSALNFRNGTIKGKTIVHTTTNGTQSIETAKTANPSEIVIGAFSNIDTLKDYLISKQKDVEILCSGWKNTFCLEDTLFAGMLSTLLTDKGFKTKDDATFAAMDLWKQAKDDLRNYIEKASHIHRLRKAKFDDVFDYTFTMNTCHNVPKLVNGQLIPAID